MRKIPFWGVISLSSIALLAVMPLLLATAFSLLPGGLQLSAPVKIFDANECKNLTSSIPCKTAFEVDGKKLETLSYSILGLANTTPTVTCIASGLASTIKPSFWVSFIAVYSNEDLKCDGRLVTFLEEKSKSPANAWIIPLSISGDESTITRFLNAVLFYHVDIRVLVAIMALFQLGLTLLTTQTIGGTYSRPKYLYSFLVVATMCIVNGGLIEKATGYDLWNAIPILKNALGFLWVATFAYETKSDDLNRRMFFKIILSVFTAALLFHSLGMTSKTIWAVILTGWTSIAIYSRFKFLPTALLALNLFYLQPVYGSLLTVPQFAGSLFLLIYILGYQIEFVRMMLINWRLSQLANRIRTVKQHRAFIKLISKVLKVKRISFAIASNDSFEYWMYSEDRQLPEKKLPTGQSSVISKVYATGEALLDLDINSTLGTKIANKSVLYRSSRFTAVPVSVNGELAGVLCFTDYEANIRHPDLRRYMIKTYEEAGVSLAKGISHSNNRLVTEIEKDVLEIFKAENHRSPEETVEGFLAHIFKRFKISGYLAKISNSNNSIEILTGSQNFIDIRDRLNNLNFSINPANEFGPISLAFVKEGPVILQNWRPLSDKLSVSAKEMYVSMDTNSIMTIPIIRRFGNTEIKYLIWLQTANDSTFTQQFHSLGLLLQTKMEQLIDSRLSNLIGDTVLSLADSDTIQNVVYGRETIIKESGELLMFDLSKSTALSGSLGVEQYKHLIDFYTKEVSGRMNHVGFQLQMVIGDALLFTRPASNTQAPREQLLKYIYECDTSLKDYVNKYDPSVYNINEPSLRVCSAIGDISRDLVKGNGGGWAIVGSTISEVHKLEAAAKKFRGGIYFEVENRSNSENLTFIETETVPWIGGSRLRFLEYTSKPSSKAA